MGSHFTESVRCYQTKVLLLWSNITTGSLVKLSTPKMILYLYFSWKKTRTRTSLMDRQARKLTSVREDGGYGEENFPEAASDEEDKEVNINTYVIG